MKKNAYFFGPSIPSSSTPASVDLPPLLTKKLADGGFPNICTESELFSKSWNYVQKGQTILSILFSDGHGEAFLDELSKNGTKRNGLCQKLLRTNWNILIDGQAAWCKFLTSFKAPVWLTSWTEEPADREKWCDKLCEADWDVGAWPPLWFRLIDHNGYMEFLMSLLNDLSDSSGRLLDKLIAANPKEGQKPHTITLMHFILYHHQQNNLLEFIFFYRSEPFLYKLLEEDWTIERRDKGSIFSCLLSTVNGAFILERLQAYPAIKIQFIEKLNEIASNSQLSEEMNTRLQAFLSAIQPCNISQLAEEKEGEYIEQELEKELKQILEIDWTREIAGYRCSVAYQYALQGQIARLFDEVKDYAELEFTLIEKLIQIDWVKVPNSEGKTKSLAFLLAETRVIHKLMAATENHPSIYEQVKKKIEAILPVLDHEQEKIDAFCHLNPALQATLSAAGFEFSSEEELLNNTSWDVQAPSSAYQGLTLSYLLVSSESGLQALANWCKEPEKKERVLKNMFNSNWSSMPSITFYTGLPFVFFLFNSPICSNILKELFNHQAYQSEVVNKIIAVDWGNACINDPELINRTVFFYLLQENQTEMLNEIARNERGRQKLRIIIDILEHNELLNSFREKLVELISLPKAFSTALPDLGFNEIHYIEDFLQQDWNIESSSYPGITLFFLIVAYCNYDDSRVLEVKDLIKNNYDKQAVFNKIMAADLKLIPKSSPVKDLPLIFWIISFSDWLNLLVEIVEDPHQKDVLLEKLSVMDIDHEYRPGMSITNVLSQTEQGRKLLNELKSYEEKLESNSHCTLMIK